MAPQESKRPNNRIFVGKLNIDVDQNALKEHFAKAGEIFSIKVKKNPKKSLAYAFINYNEESSPQKAIDDFNGKSFSGSEIEVQLAKEVVKKSKNNNNNGNNNNNNNINNNESKVANRRPLVAKRPSKKINKNNNNNNNNNNNDKELSATTLFVSNLPFAFDDEKLKQLFEGFQVKAAHTVSRNGRSKGYGFVEFENEDSAKAALDAKNKFKVEEREINVRNAFKYDESVAQKSNSTDTLYVSNLPYKLSDETLNDIFKDYGVSKAYVARTKKGRSKGFGFVVLAGEEADIAGKQEKVIAEKNQFKVEDREIYVRAAYNSAERPEHDNSHYNNNNNNNNNNNSNDDEPDVKQIALYVSNIPFSVTSEDLAGHFNDTVGFQSANVVVARKNGRSRGYGFVIFDTEENRDAALGVKKDLKVADRTLSISIARGKKANNNNNNNNNNNRRGNNNNNNNNNANRRRRPNNSFRRRRNNNDNNNNNDSN